MCKCRKQDQNVQDDGERTVQTSHLRRVGLSIYCSKSVLQLIYLALQYPRLKHPRVTTAIEQVIHRNRFHIADVVELESFQTTVSSRAQCKRHAVYLQKECIRVFEGRIREMLQIA